MNAYPLILTFVLLTTGSASAQDLLDRARQLTGTAPETTFRARRTGFNRADLSLGSGLQPEGFGREVGSARIGLDATANLDFACGKFDAKATFRSLFGKEAREEFLDGILQYGLSELAGSGLTLLCETSPTACQVLMSHRNAAGLKLKSHWDWCSAIEGGIQNGLQSARANAIKYCLEEKRAQGLSLDQAREACRDAGTLRGLGGLEVLEIDVTEELSRALNLSPEERASTEAFISDLKYTAKGATGEIRTDAVHQVYVNKVREHVEGYQTLSDRARRGGVVTQEDLDALAPPGIPAMSVEDFLALLQMPYAWLHFERMSSDAALLKTTLELHGLERRLAAARKDPTVDGAFIDRLGKEMADLRLQLRQLEELAKKQSRARDSVQTARKAAWTTAFRKGGNRLASASREEAAIKQLDSTREYGCMLRRDGKDLGAKQQMPKASRSTSPTVRSAGTKTDYFGIKR